MFNSLVVINMLEKAVVFPFSYENKFLSHKRTVLS